jgi:hypothetical protein
VQLTLVDFFSYLGGVEHNISKIDFKCV